MALRNQGTAPPATKPRFEEQDDGDTTVAESPAPAPAASSPAPAPSPAPTPAPAPSTSTALAPAPAAGAVVTSDRALANEFVEQVNAMKGAADFSYGNYTVFKGHNGEIRSSEEGVASLGRWVRGSMIAWGEHWEASPNSDSKEAKDYVGYSDDGSTIRSIIGKEKLINWIGRPIDEYVQYLRSQDFPKADKRRMIDVAFAVQESENGEMVGEIIQITLSPSSIPSFKSYQENLVQKARCVARGLPGFKLPEDPLTFYFVREAASKDGKSWTKLAVMSKLPAKL